MALVVAPDTSSVWKDPSSSMAAAAAAAAAASENKDQISIPHSTLPGRDQLHATGDVESIIKDEHGQDISCVVCADKSSGKHYGQYTCEGKLTSLLRTYKLHALIVFSLK